MRHFLPVAILYSLAIVTLPAKEKPSLPVKVKDVVLYRDAQFHSAFPSIIQRPDGELITAFRRAPDWRPLGAKSYTHTDPNSYLVLTRSRDHGQTWTVPETFFAHPWGGSQDPCLLQLRDESILCASYAWSLVGTNIQPHLKQPSSRHSNFYFLGGFLLRSKNGGASWQGPITPPSRQGESRLDIFGKPLPAYNRGALCEGQAGRLYWAVASKDALEPRRTAVHLMVSDDQGSTWHSAGTVANDPKVSFNETSLYETPKGDLVAFLRTANFNDHGGIARSTNSGKSFQPWQDMGFQGHPFHALRLPDQRVLLTYGYRHQPYGIRARVLNAECTDFATATEIVLRDDGGSEDLGYPWATMISPDQALVTYYINHADKTRYIAGTVLSLP